MYAGTIQSQPVDAIPIQISDNALKHLRRLRAEKDNKDLLLRVGVRSGGCSGLSYAMDFETPDKVAPEDSGMRFHLSACMFAPLYGHASFGTLRHVGGSTTPQADTTVPMPIAPIFSLLASYSVAFLFLISLLALNLVTRLLSQRCWLTFAHF
jgi:hypothetical protein